MVSHISGYGSDFLFLAARSAKLLISICIIQKSDMAWHLAQMGFQDPTAQLII
jgi:hypothetical protein